MSMVAAALFIVMLAGLHVLEPEFDPTWRFVSEYALGSLGWMMNVAFVALATSLASTGLAVAQQSRGKVGRVGLGILGVAVVGLCIAAVFTTDPLTGSASTPSFSGKMHVIGASLDYTPVAALLISIALTRRAEWRPMRRTLLLASVLTIVLTVGFIVSLPPTFKFGPGVYSGLIGRMLLVSYLGWSVPVAYHAARLWRAQNAAGSPRGDQSLGENR